MTAPIIGEPYLYRPGKRPRLLVAFSGLALSFGKAKPLEFMQSTAHLPYHRLFVKDVGRCWHLGGSRDKFEKILDVVQGMKLYHGTEYTHLVGSSSGGFGALLMGHLLKADRVDAFGPQTTIKKRQLARIGDGRWADCYAAARARRPEYHDLRPILSEWNGVTQYHIHTCEIRVDLRHALRLVDCPHVKIHRYPCKDHNSAKFLRKRGTLLRILKGG
jgi:hypothetical protein